MNASFDDLRVRLVSDFNDLVETELSEEQREILLSMRNHIIILLAICRPDEQPDDCNYLEGKVELKDVP